MERVAGMVAKGVVLERGVLVVVFLELAVETCSEAWGRERRLNPREDRVRERIDTSSSRRVADGGSAMVLQAISEP
jgi:hypothetical protein